MSTGPIPVGTHEFLLEASGPNPALIPSQEVVGVTVVLITCSYREQEFVRIGKLRLTDNFVQFFSRER